jgi:membrane protein implicated in regulation of membrane protease activity
MFTLEFWLILAVIFILGEILTLTFFLLSIGLGAGVAGLGNYLGFDPITQIVLFAIVTILFIIISRPLAKRLTKNSPLKKANSDRLIGKEGIVTEEIKIDKMGTVKLMGDVWKATSTEDVPVGKRVIVEKISGVKLIVKQIE